MVRYIGVALCMGCLLPIAAAEPKLAATLTYGGNDIALTHVCVLDFDDTEGMGDGPELRLLFSDKAVDKAALESPVLFNLHTLAQDGKLQGVLLRYNPEAEVREVYGTSYVSVGDPQSSMPFFTLGGDSGGVDSLKRDGDTLTGAIAYRSEGNTDFGMPAYAISITFTAPIQKATPVTTLTGKEAMETVQMKKVLAFEAALRAGDLGTVRSMTSPEKAAQMDAFIAEVGREEFLKMVKQMAPDPATREKNLRGVYTRGERTTVVFTEQGGKNSMSLIKKGDTWILD